MKKTTIDMPDDLFRGLKIYCAKTGKSMRWVVNEGVKRVMEEQNGSKRRKG